MILIPVKGFATAKQRLASVLTPDERSAFACAMLEDVLRAFAACSHPAPVAVITADAKARHVALRFGFEIIEDPDGSGETDAVARATRACVDRGEESVMVIPGDVPLISPVEIDSVLNALPGPPSAPAAVLVPAHDGRGTNAALLRPPGLFDLRFGNDSFEPHRSAASRSGASCTVLHLAGIGLDVDRPEDLAQLLRLETRTESQKLLRSWNVIDRLPELAGRARHQAWRGAP